MNIVQAARRWLDEHKERIGLIAIGHTGKRVEEFLFDYLLYGTVVTFAATTWGPLLGSLAAFLIMTPLAALLCWLYLVFYDWLKKDWLGFETIEKLRESEAEAGWLMRRIIRITKMGDIPMFFLMSVYTDAFMTTVYFRRGAETYGGLTRRDWAIFWGSLVISNLYWTIRWSVILQLVLLLWRHALYPIFS